MLVCQAIAEVLLRLGVRDFFGLMGRANLRLVLSMVDQGGMRYVAARHETAAVSMADAYARASGRLGVCTVTLGPGVTNCLTGLVEAARASTPLLLLAGDRSAAGAHGQVLDVPALCAAVAVASQRLRSPATLVDDLQSAARQAIGEQRPVVVPVPLDLQERVTAADPGTAGPLAPVPPVRPSAADVAAMAAVVARAGKPVIVAGRGALSDRARTALVDLADRTGALLATTMHAAGMFGGHPFAIGTIGVHGSPLSVELLAEADTVLAFGASLNRFTTRAGHLFPAVREIIHCDIDRSAHAGAPVTVPVTVPVTGDAAATASALVQALEPQRSSAPGYHTEDVRRAIASQRPGADGGGQRGGFVEPRSLLARLDQWLPRQRAVAPETGHACGDVVECLRVFEPRGAVNLFDSQAVGLGLAAAIGAAVARPDRITVAAAGDGGTLMALGEIETMVRYRLPVLVLVMNDGAYGAEARELELRGLPIGPATFPAVDLAAVGRALGAEGVTVRSLADLESVRPWIERPAGPIVVDCKLDPSVPAAWFVEAIGSSTAYLRHPRPGY